MLSLKSLSISFPKIDPSHHKDVDEFWTGAFENFNLQKPTELIECFGTVSGQVFFRKLRTINDLLQHSKANKNLKLHTDYAQLEVFMQALSHAHTCMFHSHDFDRLADSLHISHDHEVIKKATYLYYQAKYADLADDFGQIVEEIDNKNYNNAGKIYAELFKRSVEDYKKRGEDLLAYQAFGNGLSGTLGAALPSESVDCYKEEHAKLLMDFFRGISDAVTDAKWYRADKAAADYWEQEGRDLLSKIPSKVWRCDMKSKDSKEISEKIGIELGSQQFREKMWDYMSDHNIMFYSYVKYISTELHKGDYVHAGAAYAHLLEAIAKSA